MDNTLVFKGNYIMKNKFYLAIILTLALSTAHSNVILWDEGADGDFSRDQHGPLNIYNEGKYIIRGSVSSESILTENGRDSKFDFKWDNYSWFLNNGLNLTGINFSVNNKLLSASDIDRITKSITGLSSFISYNAPLSTLSCAYRYEEGLSYEGPTPVWQKGYVEEYESLSLDNCFYEHGKELRTHYYANIYTGVFGWFGGTFSGTYPFPQPFETSMSAEYELTFTIAAAKPVSSPKSIYLLILGFIPILIIMKRL
jgi:hypothetical protein